MDLNVHYVRISYINLFAMHPLQIPAHSAQAFRIKQAAPLNLVSLLSFIKGVPAALKVLRPVGSFLLNYGWVPMLFVNSYNEIKSPTGTVLRSPITNEYVRKTMEYLPSVYDTLDRIA